MGFFGAIIGGVTSLISGGKNRKNDARNRASNEKIAMIEAENLKSLRASEERQRAHELKLSEAKKNNKSSFIPWVIGGVASLVAIVGVIFGTKKKRR